MIIRNTSHYTIEIEAGKSIFVLHAEQDHAEANALTLAHNTSFTPKTAKDLSWPGEYEVAGGFFRVYQDGENTITEASIEGVRMLHLGSSPVSSDTLSKLENIDILILPVENTGRSVAEALSIVKNLDPRIIIPLGDLESKWIAEFGAQVPEALSKAKIMKSTLPQDKTEIIRLITES